MTATSQYSTVSMIGLGYIGLPTAALMASKGLKVTGVDVSQSVVDTINAGKIHIIEPDLDAVVHQVVASGALKATLVPEKTQAYLIAVPTPFKDNHLPDLKYIESAAKAIAPVLEKGCLVVLESTSPVGATEQLTKWLAELRTDLKFPLDEHSTEHDIAVAYCPERVLPGKVLHELVHNDRAIGGITKDCTQRAQAFYRQFVQGECFATNARTAEMAKLTENAFRDVNIAFANELSTLCEKQSINVWELIRLANRHPRVNILQPGAGVGGHCIAVDPWFIVSANPDDAQLTHTARLINDAKPNHVVKSVLEKLSSDNAKRVACLGLSFKPDIDDLRESPAVQIVSELAEKTETLMVVEPHINQLPEHLNKPGVELVSFETAKEHADIIVCLVKHTDFVQQADQLDPHKTLDFVNVLNR